MVSNPGFRIDNLTSPGHGPLTVDGFVSERVASRLLATRSNHSNTKESFLKGTWSPQTVTFKVSITASESVYQARPRTVAFSKRPSKSRRVCDGFVSVMNGPTSHGAGRHPFVTYNSLKSAVKDDDEALKLWEGFREGRRFSRDTYPESYITKYTKWFRDGRVFEAHRLLYHSA